ncbi:hypothetical protein [Mangrovihabitans endophyticus]|uniref:hypothetical protein n=1 Tax=Mangrovihabitans endophyticus TaxID=1751298 RepID=UPI00166820BC|nr:hypothetical protein [Mangrovihabitans endophyticus]
MHERPSGAFRLPEQRPGDTGYASSPYSAPDPVSSTGSHTLPDAESRSGAAHESVRLPVRGPEYPAVRPGATSLADAPPAGAGTASYGPASAPISSSPASGMPASRPVSAGPGMSAPNAYNEPTGLVPPVGARTGDSVYRTRRSASSVLVAIGVALLMVPTVMLLVHATFGDDISARGVVPAVLLTLGLPLTGTGLFALAGGGRPVGREAWLRPPVAYLPVGLLLLLAAGLAVA